MVKRQSGKRPKTAQPWKIGADGKAQVSFYTNDTGADMRVEVEGRSGARQYHYAEKVIKAKK